jgi:hypothetical protein
MNHADRDDRGDRRSGSTFEQGIPVDKEEVYDADDGTHLAVSRPPSGRVG